VAQAGRACRAAMTVRGACGAVLPAVVEPRAAGAAAALAAAGVRVTALRARSTSDARRPTTTIDVSARPFNVVLVAAVSSGIAAVSCVPRFTFWRAPTHVRHAALARCW
jgi:hypothetical protein